MQLSSVQVVHLGSGSAGKCEENISVKRIISQFFSPFLYYFEVVISQVWLDARPSNFDGRLSVTPRFYPCKLTAQVRNKNFTSYNMLNSHLSHKRT